MSSAKSVGLNKWLRKVKGQIIVNSVRCWKPSLLLTKPVVSLPSSQGHKNRHHPWPSEFHWHCRELRINIFFKCDWHFYNRVFKVGYSFIFLQELLIRFSFPPHKPNFMPILSWFCFITPIISRGFSPASFRFLSLKTKNYFQYYFSFQTHSAGFTSLRWRWPKTVLPFRPNNVATGFLAV